MLQQMTMLRREHLPPELLAEMRPYECTRDWAHSEGQDIHNPRLTLNFRKGDIFEYGQGVLIHLNRVHEIQNMNSFEAALAKDWAVQTGGEIDLSIQRAKEVRGLTKKHNNLTASAQQQVQQQVEQGPKREIRGLVHVIGGAEVLPPDWDTQDWSFKRAYIGQMTDVALLDDMLFDADERLARSINNRIAALTGTAPALAPAPAPVAAPVNPQPVAVKTAAPAASTAPASAAPPAPLPAIDTSNMTDEQKAVAELMARTRAKAQIPRQAPPKDPPKFKAATAEPVSEKGAAYYEEDMEGEEVIPVDLEPAVAEPELANKFPVTRRGRPRKDKSGRNSDFVAEESGTMELEATFDDIEGPNGEKITGF